MPHRDRAARLDYQRRWYAERRELLKAAATRRYANDGHRIRAERAAKRTDETRRTASAAQRERYRALRLEIVRQYGSACACCREAELCFLELDHVDDSGSAHRREIGRGSYATYQWVKRHGYPSTFRLLCANCNQGRQRNGGVCPHAR